MRNKPESPEKCTWMKRMEQAEGLRKRNSEGSRIGNRKFHFNENAGTAETGCEENNRWFTKMLGAFDSANSGSEQTIMRTGCLSRTSTCEITTLIYRNVLSYDMSSVCDS